jgi:8-oxo-dGTP pyrophosphatase MutT (NUDIX family)
MYGVGMPRFSLVPAAYVALLRDDQVLLQQRQNTGYMDGHWSFSAAGHVERDESVTAAAVREAREELGIHIAEVDLEPLCTIHRRQNELDGGQRVDFFFTASAWEGEPAVQEPEHSGGIAWAPISALPQPLVAVDALALEMLRTGKRTAIVHWGFDG